MGFLGLTLATHALQAQDQSAEIRALLEDRDREVKNLLGNQDTFTETQRTELKSLINDVIDFEAMSEIALGRHWNDLTAAQRTEFVEVFSEIVRAQSLSDLEVYRAAVTYEEINVVGDSAYVRTKTVYKEVPAKVEYILGLRNDQWSAQDIILDEVSTAEGYARSFQSVIRKKGFDALMKSLYKKRDKMNASS